MPTLAQQWMADKWIEEGRAEGLAQARTGLLSGIEVALDLRFGSAGLALLPEIRSISDLNLLHALLTAVRDAKGIDQVRAAYRA